MKQPSRSQLKRLKDACNGDCLGGCPVSPLCDDVETYILLTYERFKLPSKWTTEYIEMVGRPISNAEEEHAL